MSTVADMISERSSAIDRFDGIGLQEVARVAELQTRRDRKYLLPAGAVPGLLDGLLGLGRVRVLTIDGLRSFRYRSVYFDTPELDSYLGSARQRPRRFKVRTRHYLDTATCHFEVKVRDGRGHTVKHRLDHQPCDDGVMTDDARRFAQGLDQVAPAVDHLAPTLTTTYRRTTFALDRTEVRATVDDELAWDRPDGTTIALDGWSLVETKTTGPPSDVDRMLWRAGHRPVRISKYCTGLAASDDRLPANKWHRLLQRHFAQTSTEHQS